MGTKGRVWVTIGTHKCDAKSLMDFNLPQYLPPLDLKGVTCYPVQTPQTCRSSSLIWTLSTEPRHLHF